MKYTLSYILVCTLLLLSACGQNAQKDTSVKAVEDSDWLKHGHGFDEKRHSPDTQINQGNVQNLGLAWHFDYPTSRGLEATPIVSDGILYSTSSWNLVFAHNAKTGELLWSYDPKVAKEWGVNLCCDAVNRGVALHDSTLFMGALDGRLIAIDATKGKLLWSVQTTPKDKPYSITGAPRVIGNKVIIGNGGGEYGVRGYVSAYDVSNGDLLWRFFTTPGNPDDPFENKVLAQAVKTWGGGAWWEVGGGGTVWDSMAYDEDLNLLYIGIGNGAPWNRNYRSPEGGDNLFLSSIVALNVQTGEYVWHYQTTPGDEWDYTATQHMILADLDIDGQTRKVIMQAPKNGFFYVIDRTNGDFISGQPYTKVTWASHIDKTGRPVENKKSRYTNTNKPTGTQFPGPLGGHNWHPMSYSPNTGLVYIPEQQVPWNYVPEENYKYNPAGWNTGTDFQYAGIPSNPIIKVIAKSLVKGSLVAWDPIKKRKVWSVSHDGPWNGGVLSTASDLVFQGNSSAQIVSYSAQTGKQLWSFDAQTGVVAPPISYAIDGEQYIAVLAGWGGSFGLAGGEIGNELDGAVNRSRLLVFKLGGKDQLPAAKRPKKSFNPPPLIDEPSRIANGKAAYIKVCAVCHGDGAVGSGVLPDLREMGAQKHQQWPAIVFGGSRAHKGMVGFANQLSYEQVNDIQVYIISFKFTEAMREKI